MNELEKTLSNEDIVNPASNADVEANLEKTDMTNIECDGNSDVCAEKESPAESLSEATDKLQGESANSCESHTDECVETESPSESLSEVTDSIEGKCAAEGVCAENVCVETESPADAISEATDVIEGAGADDDSKEKVSDVRRFHSMNKEELVAALADIVKSGNVAAYKDVAAIKTSFYIIHSQQVEDALMKHIDAGNSPESFTSPADPMEVKLKELTAEFKEKRSAHLEAEEARLNANVDKAKDILSKMKTLSDDIDNINLNFNNFRELQQQFRDIKEFPPTADTDLWKEYQRAGEEFYDRLKVNRELRDLDFKKNLEAKELLIAEAEKLTEMEDPLQAFNRQKELQIQWREIGPVQKELRDEVWNRFREASTIIFKRHQDYFAARKAEESAAQSRKVDLCEKMEGIDLNQINSYTKWEEETRKVIALQSEWKEAGFASRKVNNQLFARFREACDKFFAAKTEYYKAMKAVQSENLAKKTALCEKVEALKESTNMENLDSLRSACDKVAAAQADWRKIGAVPRKQSDVVWKRFCDACQVLYEKRKELTVGQRKEESANLAKKKDIVAQLKAIDTKADRQEGISRLRELQAEWQATGHVPYKAKDALQEDYRLTVKKLYDELDVHGRKERFNKFDEHIEKLSGDDNQLSRERDRLYRALDGKRNELKTAENNLGFFNIKSSAGNSLLKGVEGRIERLKEEINEIKNKIDLLNSKMS
ncbi:MAG: DUF349 domain-containing protein [Prevotella sp.]|nr:DUF349 domain-containing protein [Bacteroides sp.]MCM1365957.1 DUF349 domain-containing protein [Prevotella sp.]MCM1436622.1 DUF349 domain-containing protein [Prevotella sp.]